MIKVLGLDIGRNQAVGCLLSNFPDNITQWFKRNKRSCIYKFNADPEGIKQLLDLQPDVIILEPTGFWYSQLWVKIAKLNNIEIKWVGHLSLASKRRGYGFSSKRDEEDALCLAACYFDSSFNQYINYQQYQKIDDIRLKFLDLEQLDKVRNALVNQLKQRLTLEFPEISQRNFVINDNLGFTPVIGWLSGSHDYTRINNEYAKSIVNGITEISEYTRSPAKNILALEVRITKINQQLTDLMSDKDFTGYMSVFDDFGFGVTLKALMLIACYPMDKFLFEGKPLGDWEETRPGKWSKRHRSLSKFQGFLGLGYKISQSGDKSSKSFHGSKITRTHLYMWLVARIAVKPPRRVEGAIGELLGDHFDQLREPTEGKAITYGTLRERW
jgi:hypothetical protein